MAQFGTLKNARGFLDALSETGNVSDACRINKLPRRTVYNWRKENAKFAEEWKVSLEMGTEALEDEAVRRAKDGVDKPVFQGGKLVGHVREYSDTLLIFLLKGAKPQKYRDNVALEHNGNVGVQLVHSIPRPQREAR
jgi:hypothetical protein